MQWTELLSYDGVHPLLGDVSRGKVLSDSLGKGSMQTLQCRPICSLSCHWNSLPVNTNSPHHHPTILSFSSNGIQLMEGILLSSIWNKMPCFKFSQLAVFTSLTSSLSILRRQKKLERGFDAASLTWWPHSPELKCMVSKDPSRGIVSSTLK